LERRASTLASQLADPGEPEEYTCHRNSPDLPPRRPLLTTPPPPNSSPSTPSSLSSAPPYAYVAGNPLAQDTPENRDLIKCAISPDNLRSTQNLANGAGTLDTYFLTLNNGKQVWAEVRNGSEITNGGLNDTPR